VKGSWNTKQCKSTLSQVELPWVQTLNDTNFYLHNLESTYRSLMLLIKRNKVD